MSYKKEEQEFWKMIFLMVATFAFIMFLFSISKYVDLKDLLNLFKKLDVTKIPFKQIYEEIKNADAFSQILMCLPVMFSVITFFIWLKNQDFKSEKCIKVDLNFANEYTSYEISHFYKGKLKKDIVTPIFFELANEGYLKILYKETETDLGFDKEFTIVKLKEYDGRDVNKRIIFEGLLNNNPYDNINSILQNKEITNVTNNTKSQINLLDVSGIFNKFVEIVTNNVISKLNIFKAEVENEKKIISIMCLITFLIMLPEINIGIVIFLGITIFFIPWNEIIQGISNSRGVLISEKYWNIFVTFSVIMFSIYMVEPIYYSVISYYDTKVKIIKFVISIMCLIFMLLMLFNVSNLNSYGKEMNRKCKSLKSYLLNLDITTLKSVFAKDKDFFAKILPYAYSLDMLDKWIFIGEECGIYSVNWYDGNKSFKHGLKRFIPYLKTVSKATKKLVVNNYGENEQIK